MTAVDVDALDKLREAATAGGWPAVDAMFAVQRALPELIAEVRRGRALRAAVEWLIEQLVEEAAVQKSGEYAWGMRHAVADIRFALAAVDAS